MAICNTSFAAGQYLIIFFFLFSKSFIVNCGRNLSNEYRIRILGSCIFISRITRFYMSICNWLFLSCTEKRTHYALSLVYTAKWVSKAGVQNYTKVFPNNIYFCAIIQLKCAHRIACIKTYNMRRERLPWQQRENVP